MRSQILDWLSPKYHVEIENPKFFSTVACQWAANASLLLQFWFQAWQKPPFSVLFLDHVDSVKNCFSVSQNAEHDL